MPVAYLRGSMMSHGHFSTGPRFLENQEARVPRPPLAVENATPDNSLWLNPWSRGFRLVELGESCQDCQWHGRSSKTEIQQLTDDSWFDAQADEILCMYTYMQASDSLEALQALKFRRFIIGSESARIGTFQCSASLQGELQGVEVQDGV